MSESRTPLPAHVIAYTDSTFTDPHEVVSPEPAPDCRGQYTHMGARYSGFETARHPGHVVDAEARAVRFDHFAGHELHLGLDAPARVDGLGVSTRWFTGNQVPRISVDLKDAGDWVEVLERVPLDPDAIHDFDLAPFDARECRIRCHQEGGIARVHLYGTPLDAAPPPANLFDEARISHVSNVHFGKPAQAVAGRRQVHHMIGWESARSGFGEQALFSLEAPAVPSMLVVDTYLHRLNPPRAAWLFGLPPGVDPDEAMERAPRWRLTFLDGSERIPEDFARYMRGEHYLGESAPDPGRFAVDLAVDRDGPWRPLVPFAPLHADRLHRLPIDPGPAVAHVLFRFYPNGGIHGLALHGTPADD